MSSDCHRKWKVRNIYTARFLLILKWHAQTIVKEFFFAVSSLMFKFTRCRFVFFLNFYFWCHWPALSVHNLNNRVQCHFASVSILVEMMSYSIEARKQKNKKQKKEEQTRFSDGTLIYFNGQKWICIYEIEPRIGKNF